MPLAVRRRAARTPFTHPTYPMSDPTRIPTPPDREVFVYDEYEHGPTDYGRRTAAVKRISWAAIFAGAVVAVVTGFLLNLLGLGIGLQAFDPATDPDTLGGFGIGQGVWAILSSLASLFAGGWVAGRLAGMPRDLDGALHGVVVWGLTTLVTLYFLTSGVGRVVSGVTGLIGSGLSAVGSGVAAVAPDAARYAGERLGVDPSEIELADIRAEAEALLRDTGDPALQPGALEDAANRAADGVGDAAAQAEVRDALDRAYSRADGVVSAVDRDDLVNVIAARSDLSEAEARQRVDAWEGLLQAARQTVSAEVDSLRSGAVATAETATDYLGTTALIGFFALLLGALAAGFGGKTGSPDPLPAGAFRRD